MVTTLGITLNDAQLIVEGLSTKYPVMRIVFSKTFPLIA